ncbi:MAG: hypothetical protein ACRCXZ_10545, partial [Patescibacteria group bacterium]
MGNRKGNNNGNQGEQAPKQERNSGVNFNDFGFNLSKLLNENNFIQSTDSNGKILLIDESKKTKFFSEITKLLSQLNNQPTKQDDEYNQCIQAIKDFLVSIGSDVTAIKKDTEASKLNEVVGRIDEFYFLVQKLNELSTRTETQKNIFKIPDSIPELNDLKNAVNKLLLYSRNNKIDVNSTEASELIVSIQGLNTEDSQELIPESTREQYQTFIRFVLEAFSNDTEKQKELTNVLLRFNSLNENIKSEKERLDSEKQSRENSQNLITQNKQFLAAEVTQIRTEELTPKIVNDIENVYDSIRRNGIAHGYIQETAAKIIKLELEKIKKEIKAIKVTDDTFDETGRQEILAVLEKLVEATKSKEGLANLKGWKNKFNETCEIITDSSKSKRDIVKTPVARMSASMVQNQRVVASIGSDTQNNSKNFLVKGWNKLKDRTKSFLGKFVGGNIGIVKDQLTSPFKSAVDFDREASFKIDNIEGYRKRILDMIDDYKFVLELYLGKRIHRAEDKEKLFNGQYLDSLSNEYNRLNSLSRSGRVLSDSESEEREKLLENIDLYNNLLIAQTGSNQAKAELFQQMANQPNLKDYLNGRNEKRNDFLKNTSLETAQAAIAKLYSMLQTIHSDSSYQKMMRLEGSTIPDEATALKHFKEFTPQYISVNKQSSINNTDNIRTLLSTI